MFAIGDISIRAQRLINITRECLEMAIRLVRPGTRLGDIGAAIQQHAEGNGFSVVREYCGQAWAVTISCEGAPPRW